MTLLSVCCLYFVYRIVHAHQFLCVEIMVGCSAIVVRPYSFEQYIQSTSIILETFELYFIIKLLAFV